MHTLAIGMPGAWEWIVILVIGLLLFGRRLPEVGRSLGRGIVEFKKGIKGIEDEIESASSPPPSRSATQPPPEGREPAATPRPALRQPEQWEGEGIANPQSAAAPRTPPQP